MSFSAPPERPQRPGGEPPFFRYNKPLIHRHLALIAAAAATALPAQVTRCACDPSRPETMQARHCSLCGEAEKHPAGTPFFFLRDNNPHKPNRWLILPRDHKYDGALPLAKMSKAERLALWRAAIGKASSLWGGEWGLAINGDEVRTQCHAHLHIGRILKGVEYGRPLVVRGPADIPAPRDGTGMWIHPAGKKLHVHLGEQRAETVLFR